MSCLRAAFIERALVALLVCIGVPALDAQARPERGRAATAPPRISARTFTGGSAKVTVTRGFRMDAEVPINTTASMADGEMTWLQFGASGSADPNALITVSLEEIGVTAGKGKQIFIAEAAECAGKLDVSAILVSGRYSCKGITAYDATARRMSTVDISITFTARS